MISQITKYVGNTVTLASATVASFSDNFRLWIIAILGLGITWFGAGAKRYKDKIEAQASRQRLCDECLKNDSSLKTCVVKESQRPINCKLSLKK